MGSPKTRKCARCDGSGQIMGWSTWETCPACHGKGRFRLPQKPEPDRAVVDCARCDASGRVMGWSGWETCPACGGRGWQTL